MGGPFTITLPAEILVQINRAVVEETQAHSYESSRPCRALYVITSTLSDFIIVALFTLFYILLIIVILTIALSCRREKGG